MSPEPPKPTPAPSPQACELPCYGEPRTSGYLDTSVVPSVSGMAASLRTPGAYYVVSDEAGTDSVAMVREDGTLIARVAVDGMDARNAEALATGPCGPEVERVCLYIGDIGNHVDLPDAFVYRMPEPDVSSPPGQVRATKLRYTYPGEPTDAEALMVDDQGRPLIISKAEFDDSSGETGQTVVYRGAADGGKLEHLAEFTLPEPANGVFASMVGNVVTGASASDAGVLLRTYDEVLEYRSADQSADLASFLNWPMRRVPAPSQVQSESVTYRSEGCGYLTTAEVLAEVAVVACDDATRRPSP